jgi:hypothetical protein
MRCSRTIAEALCCWFSRVDFMQHYHALCSDCPKCGKENIAFLAYSRHNKGVNFPTLKRMTCCHCFHEYQQSIQEMVLRPKTQAEIDAAGGEHTLAWI